LDHLSPDRRSANMRAVKGKNTKPEMIVRRAAHALGLRFRLHYADLPGRPDLVFPKYRTAVFVNGCFWHGHGCRRGKLPNSNSEFWISKIQANVLRDRKNYRLLRRLGWRVLVIWQCNMKRPEDATAAISRVKLPS
jgi:DNA mismatch endonuclease, patch repair protein